MKQRQRILACVVTAITIGYTVYAAKAADLFTLSSTTFRDGHIMPKKVSNNAENSKNDPNCVGENVSPEFSWANVPGGTRSFIFFMIDPEGRGGAAVFHWVAYGIPASVSEFAEGEVGKSSKKYVGGKSTQGVGIYSGPCTLLNTTPHHYTFILVATDFDSKELPPGMTHDEVTQKIAPNGGAPIHAKGSAGLVGLFVNPWHE
jgi:Raf kinase inhibitor-like YbhB/YbcL family protein